MSDNTDFDRIMQGLNEAVAYVEGEADVVAFRVHVPDEVDVRAVRKGLGLTQEAFAAKYGFGKGTVRDWEQKRRRPEASARAFLTVLAKEPEAVERALSAG